MFTKVKELRVSQLSVEIEKLLELQQREEELSELVDIPEMHYSFLKKFFKRKEYKEYSAKISELEEKVRKISQEDIKSLEMIQTGESSGIKGKILSILNYRKNADREKMLIEDKKKRLFQQKKELSKTSSKRKEELQRKFEEYNTIMEAKSFKDLGIDFHQAVYILHRANLPVILEKKDDIENPHRDYKGLEDFVLVHRTDRMPTGNRLKSIAEEEKIIIRYPFNGKIYEFPCDGEKNSIQYILNNEMQIGSWKDCRFTVIIPVSEINKELIGGVSPGNTYTIGGVDLTKKCYVLCKREDAQELRKENPKLALNNIIECEGNSIEGASKILLKLLGYRVEEPENIYNYDSWNDKESEENMKNIMKKNGLRYEGYQEKANYEEYAIRGVNVRIAIYSGIKKYGLIQSKKDVDIIINQFNFCPISKEALGCIDIMYSKLEDENIIVSPENKKFIKSIIGMEEEELCKWMENKGSNIEFNEMIDFTRKRLNLHREKKQKNPRQNYSIIAHVKEDIINKSVFEAIALSRDELTVS